MKKILFVSESLGGGLRKHIVQLIQNLDQSKFELYLIHGSTTIDETFLSLEDELKMRCSIIPCFSLSREINLKKDIESTLFILKKIGEIEPDIIHCHSSKAGVVGRIAAKLKGISKIYYTPHAYSFLSPEFSDSKRKLFILIEKILSKFATTKTFTVSQSEQKAAITANIDSIEKIDIIYNGLPEKELPSKKKSKEKLGLSESNFVVGNCARLSKQKDPFSFIEIAKNIVENNSNVFFIWIGDGPFYEEVNGLIKEYGIERNVKLLGYRKDSGEIVSAYDVFLTTALYEGLPYSPIEALRAGVPVIATDVVGNNDIVQDNINGKLLSGNVISEGTEILNDIINKKLYFRTEDIKQTFQKKFSLDIMVQNITAEYER